MNLVGLNPDNKKKVKDYSLGMKQKSWGLLKYNGKPRYLNS